MSFPPRFVLLALLLMGRVAGAQPTGLLDSLQIRYPFLTTAANPIENAAIGLQHFYRRLARLPGAGRVRVVHIGDSHIQTDEWSGRVRADLQRRYGNAGRGLVFPLRVAKTGEPATFRTAAAGVGAWRARRVLAAADTALPVGVSGISLLANEPGAALALRILAHGPLDYRFNRLTVLRQPGARALDWQVRTSTGQLLGTVPGAGPAVAGALDFDSLQSAVELHPVRRHPGQTQALLFGLLLDNGQPGVVYHAIGVNGAAVRHYNRAPQFFAQLPLLEPDLFIVSLGTNDAYDAGFDPAQFRRQLDTLVSRLRRAVPRADVLLTAPADSYRARRYRNPDLARLRAVLREYAAAHDLAYWDLAAVQGGYGSMRRWQAAGLAQTDLVHFTSAGYALQGFLLYLALLHGLASFPAR